MRDAILLCIFILLAGSPGVLISLIYAEFLIGFLLISFAYCFFIGFGFWRYCKERYNSASLIGCMAGTMCFLLIPPYIYNLRFNNIEAPAMLIFYVASTSLFLGIILFSRRKNADRLIKAILVITALFQADITEAQVFYFSPELSIDNAGSPVKLSRTTLIRLMNNEQMREEFEGTLGVDAIQFLRASSERYITYDYYLNYLNIAQSIEVMSKNKPSDIHSYCPQTLNQSQLRNLRLKGAYRSRLVSNQLDKAYDKLTNNNESTIGIELSIAIENLAPGFVPNPNNTISEEEKNQLLSAIRDKKTLERIITNTAESNDVERAVELTGLLNMNSEIFNEIFSDEELTGIKKFYELPAEKQSELLTNLRALGGDDQYTTTVVAVVAAAVVATAVAAGVKSVRGDYCRGFIPDDLIVVPDPVPIDIGGGNIPTPRPIRDF